MYEVNANNNKSFSSRNAKSVASVAVKWRKDGLRPRCYAISVDDQIETREVEITTVAATAAALAR